MWTLQVDAIYSSPLSRAKETAQSIADLQSLAGFSQPPVRESEDLNNRDWGSLEGREASEVSAVSSLLTSGVRLSKELQALNRLIGIQACHYMQKLLPGHNCEQRH